jgi:hypothetical protein
LSPLKHGAVVTDPNENVKDTLEEIGAIDIMKKFVERARILHQMDSENFENLKNAIYKDQRETLDKEDQHLADAALMNKLNRLELAVNQLDSAIAFAENMSVYLTPPDNFHALPWPVRVNKYQDLYKADLADVFVALCHCPPKISNVLFINNRKSENIFERPKSEEITGLKQQNLFTKC